MTFLEDPLPIVLVGIVIEAILAGVYFSTRRGVVLLVMLGALFLTFAMLVLERAVVTQREQVEATLDGVANALDANDWERVKEYCAPDAQSTRARVDYAERLVRITDTSIHNLRIEISNATTPPSAEAKFDGVVVYEGKTGSIGYGRYPARFVVKLELIDGRWLVIDHVEYELQRP
jgi:hypothetical protein